MAAITSIDEFINNSFLSPSRGGFLKPSRFEMVINLPTFLTNGTGFDREEITNVLRFNLISISTPGISIQDSDQNPLRSRFVMRNLDNISLQFYESTDLKIKRFFHLWMNTMIRHNDDVDNFQRNYPDTMVASELILYPLMPSGKRANGFEIFNKVYPISAGSMSYDVGDENNVGKVPVTLKYRFHKMRYEFPVTTT